MSEASAEHGLVTHEEALVRARKGLKPFLERWWRKGKGVAGGRETCLKAFSVCVSRASSCAAAPCYALDWDIFFDSLCYWNACGIKKNTYQPSTVSIAQKEGLIVPSV